MYKLFRNLCPGGYQLILTELRRKSDQSSGPTDLNLMSTGGFYFCILTRMTTPIKAKL